MLFSNVEGMPITSNVTYRQNESVSKFQVLCPDVNKMCNKGMSSVYLIDEKVAAYHLDHKSTNKFYLWIVFDLMDIACANSYIIYNMMHPNDLTLLDFKIIVSNYLVGRYTSRSRVPLDGKNRFQKKVSVSV